MKIINPFKEVEKCLVCQMPSQYADGFIDDIRNIMSSNNFWEAFNIDLVNPLRIRATVSKSATKMTDIPMELEKVWCQLRYRSFSCSSLNLYRDVLEMQFITVPLPTRFCTTGVFLIGGIRFRELILSESEDAFPKYPEDIDFENLQLPGMDWSNSQSDQIDDYSIPAEILKICNSLELDSQRSSEEFENSRELRESVLYRFQTILLHRRDLRHFFNQNNEESKVAIAKLARFMRANQNPWHLEAAELRLAIVETIPSISSCLSKSVL